MINKENNHKHANEHKFVQLDANIKKVFRRITKYSGNCKNKSKYCSGEDSYPLTNTYNNYQGPNFCAYHATIIYKLQLLTLSQLEYLARKIGRLGINIHECKEITFELLDNKKMHKIRLIAMKVSDDYFRKNYKAIFNVT